MPPAPEFADILRDIWIIEVLGKLEPDHSANANGHVGVTRKIKIDLEGVSDDAYPCQVGRQFFSFQGKYDIDLLSQDIGYQHLLG